MIKMLCYLIGLFGLGQCLDCPSYCALGDNMSNSPECIQNCQVNYTAQNYSTIAISVNSTAVPTTVTKTPVPITTLLTSTLVPTTLGTTKTMTPLVTTPITATTIADIEDVPCCYIITYGYGFNKPVTKACPCPFTTNKEQTDSTTSSASTTVLSTTSSTSTSSTTGSTTTTTANLTSSTTTTPKMTYSSTKSSYVPTTSKLVDTTTTSTGSTSSSIRPTIVTTTSTPLQLTTEFTGTSILTTSKTTAASSPTVTTTTTSAIQTSNMPATVTNAVNTENTVTKTDAPTTTSLSQTPSKITTSLNSDTTVTNPDSTTSSTTDSSTSASATSETSMMTTSTATDKTTRLVTEPLTTGKQSPTTTKFAAFDDSTTSVALFLTIITSTSTVLEKRDTTTAKVKTSASSVTSVSTQTSLPLTDDTARTTMKATTKSNAASATILRALTTTESLTTPKTTTVIATAPADKASTAKTDEIITTIKKVTTTQATTKVAPIQTTASAADAISNTVLTSSKLKDSSTSPGKIVFPKDTTSPKLSTTTQKNTKNVTTTTIPTLLSTISAVYVTTPKISSETPPNTDSVTTTVTPTTTVKPTLNMTTTKSATSTEHTPDTTKQPEAISSTVSPKSKKSVPSTKTTLSASIPITSSSAFSTKRQTTVMHASFSTTTQSKLNDRPSSTSATLPTAMPITETSKTQSTGKRSTVASTTVKINASKPTSTIIGTTKSVTSPQTTKSTQKATSAIPKTVTSTSQTQKTVTSTSQFPTTTTPCECANSGVCNENGTCSCPDGYFGENCDATLPSPGVAAATTAVTVALAASQSSSSRLKYLWPRYSASIRSPTTPHEFFRLLATYWLTVALGVNSMFGIPSSTDIKNLPKCSMAYLFGTGAFFFSLTAMLFEAGVDALTLSGMRFNAWARPAERRPRCFSFWSTFTLYVLVGVAPTAGLWLKHWTSCVTPRSCIGSLGYIYGDYDQDIKNASWLQLTITVFYVAMAMTLGILAIACNKFDVCRCRRRTEAWSINPYIYGREIWPLEANAYLWLVAIQPLLFALSWISYIYVNDMKTSVAQWINLIITSIYSVTSTIASALTTSQELSCTVMSALTALPPRFLGIMPTLDHVSLRDKDNIKQVQMRPSEWETHKQKELNGGPKPLFPLRLEILPYGLIDYMCHLWSLAYIRLRDSGLSSEAAIMILTHSFLQQKPDLRNINVFTFAILFAHWVAEVREKDSNNVPIEMIRKSRAIIDRRLDINKPPPMLVVKEHRNDIVYRKRVPHLTPIFSDVENPDKPNNNDDEAVYLDEIHPSFIGPHRETHSASALIPRKLVSEYMKDFPAK